MRLALVSLMALGLASTAFAQDTAPAAAPTPQAAPTPATPAASAPAPAPAATPTPPAPPTDPVAIAVLSTLDNVCAPADDGGDLAKLAKAAGYKKSGDNWVYSGKGFKMTILPPGSNPGQCHVDLIHPVYPDGAAKPIVTALDNWAAVSRGYSLYRNDKSPAGSPQELTTRSWEHDDGPKHEALVITTFRKADGSPAKGNADTSTMLYSISKTAG